MVKNIFSKIFVIVLLTGALSSAWGQNDTGTPLWDNQLFLGNKLTWGKDKLRYSGELQVRLKDNMQSLDNWYIEGIASYMPSQHWEIVPDFRISVHPDQTEFRPAFGILRKDLVTGRGGGRHQFVNQLKGQADIQPQNVNYGLRYILFYNYLVSEKILASGIGGVFYSWKENFTGLEYIRGGAGVAYIFNKQHSLNVIYFVGAANLVDSWTYQGNAVVQLIINITKEYKYVPAKYLSF
jgi:hypothetical protein